MKKNNPYFDIHSKENCEISFEDWKKVLTDEQFRVLRNKGTEKPFTGFYNEFDEKGTYYCSGCGNALFRSDAKFSSGCGWPSFCEIIKETAVIYIKDFSHGMQRIEVLCSRCKGHLGHVFEDGPEPKGLRYCMNSVSLDFEAN